MSDRKGFPTMDSAMEAAHAKGREWEGADGRGLIMGWCAISSPGGGWFGRVGFMRGPSLDVWPDEVAR